MTKDALPCPPEESLAALAAGVEPAAALIEHLAACAPCRATLDRFRDEELFARRFAGAMHSDVGVKAARQHAQSHAHAVPDVPGYTVLGELSRGGQGVVYRAVQHETKREVAIKTMLRGALSSGREIARFEREVEIAASLRHPGIVTVFEARQLADGRHVLAMELIEGVPLSSWADPAAQTQPASRQALHVRLTLLRDVARAVQYAHGKGVIHRDLKPANILVDAEGSPHVLDFGLARRGIDPALAHAGESDSRSSGSIVGLSIAGTFQGTPAYAAPEQFEGDPALIDVRTDVYALGVILYELLTGQPPFADSKGDLGIIAAQKRSSPLLPAPRTHKTAPTAGITADAGAVIAKATAVSRDARYASAGALADDLDALLTHQAVSARTGRVYRAAKFLRKHRLGVTALSVIILAAAGGAVAIVASSVSTQAARQREQIERERSRVEGAKAVAVAHILNDLIPFKEPEFPTLSSPQRLVINRLHDSLNGGAIADRPEVQIALHNLLARIYADRNAPGFAHVNLARVVELTTQIYGPDHPETGEALAQLAAILIQRGSLDEALIHTQSALRIRIARFGDADPSVGATKDLLARIHLAAGRIDEAQASALSAQRTLASPMPPSVAHACSLRTLSEIRARQGLPQEARELATRSMTELLRLVPDENPEIARGLRSCALVDPSRAALASLASDLQAARPDARSSQVWERWISEKEALLGANDERVAHSCRTYASVLRERHEERAALPPLDRAIQIYSITRGEGSLVIAECLEEKYKLYNYMDFDTRDEPERILARRLDILRHSKENPGNIWIAVAWREYAYELFVFSTPGSARFNKGEAELEAAARFAREHLGKSLESTRAPVILAVARYLKGDIKSALAVAQEAYDDSLAVDPDHLEMSWKATVLGCLLAANGQLDRAEPLLSDQGVVSFLRTWGRVGELARTMCKDAAASFHAQGRDAPALMLERALEVEVPFRAELATPAQPITGSPSPK